MTMQIYCSSSSLLSLIQASSVAVAGSNDFCGILMVAFLFPSILLYSLIRILLKYIPLSHLMICSFIYTVWAHGHLCGIYYCLLLWLWEPSRLAPMPLTCQLHFKPFSLPDTARGLAANCQHYPIGTCFSKRQACLN